jgi:hypothetical protein
MDKDAPGKGIMNVAGCGYQKCINIDATRNKKKRPPVVAAKTMMITTRETTRMKESQQLRTGTRLLRKYIGCLD